VAVISGEDDLLEAFENVPSYTRQEIDDYAAGLRQSSAISDIERAYGDLITLLRRKVRQDSTRAPNTGAGGGNRAAGAG
jgi:hypothetical protein